VIRRSQPECDDRNDLGSLQSWALTKRIEHSCACRDDRGALTIDNLISGLIGAVIGAILVIAWERWVWSRENHAAARLVFSELQLNEAYLKAARDVNAIALNLLGTAAWDAEQVRVANILNPKDLLTVVTAYFSILQIPKVIAEMGKEAAERWSVETPQGQRLVARALVMTRKALATIAKKVPPPSESVVAEWERDVDQELAHPT
jgi:hypothetical protein